MNKKYSQIKAMLAISKASMTAMAKNPSTVFFTIFFPLIFIVIFGFLGEGGFKVDVGVQSTSDTLNPVYENLKKVENVKLISGLTDEELLSRLNRGKVDVLISITRSPDGKMPLYNIEMKSNKASPEKAGVFSMIIGNIIDKMNLAYLKKGSVDPGLNIANLNQKYVQGRVYKTIDFILPGQLGFSILSAGIFGTAFIFLILRETLVIKRYFVTPIKKIYIVLSETIARVIFSLLGSMTIVLIGYFFFGFTLTNGFLTFINMMILSVLGLVVFLGFGFVVSNISNSMNTISPIANLITIPQFLLAGTFFSIDAFPSWLQPVCKILPLTYLNTAMRRVAFEGAGLADVSWEILVLLIWGVLVYALAVKFFKWE